MDPSEIHGRFLPSRVFNRWKWPVRIGLLVVPFLLLLSGGITLFLTPSKYQSTTLFSIEQGDKGPSAREVVELVKSRNTLERACRRLELANRFDVDMETAQRILCENISAKTVPETNLVEVSVTLLKNTDSRDVAQAIPESLHTALVEADRNDTARKAQEIVTLIHQASDAAQETAANVANLEKVHGAPPADNAAATLLERARRNSLLADAEVERLKALHTARMTEGIDSLPSLSIHSSPVISSTPHSPNMGRQLGELVLHSLGWGLLAALVIPYLLELAIPPFSRKAKLAAAGFDS